jgi:hypothetical protein
MVETTVAEVRECEPVEEIVEVRIVASFPWVREQWQIADRQKRLEQLAGEYQREVKAFFDFLRDHRSQDAIDLEVDRQRATVCSLCKEPWEVYEEDGVRTCASCGGRIKGDGDGKG